MSRAGATDDVRWDRDDPAQVHARLDRWARAEHGAHARVGDVVRMPGHSGTTYGFTLVGTGADAHLVIRVPPWGVKHDGVTDVLRQVPLLEVLADHGVPVPRVRASGDDPRWFGTPYLVVDRVDGAMPGDMFGGEVPAPTRDERDVLFEAAMGALARIHTVDVARLPEGWSTPTSPADLVEHWTALLERSGWPELEPVGRVVRERLLARVPTATSPGLVHGDYYQNNWLVHRGALNAVLDWESAHLAPTAIDIGYVAMMYDAPSWDGALRTDLVDPGRPESLLDAYARAAGREPVAPTWFRALAGLRLGALTAYFLRLHRTGRRPDATWETIGRSAPSLLERAAALAASRD